VVDGPPGWIRLTIQGSEMTSNLLTPSVRINGWTVPSRYGVQDLAVHPGPNRVEVHAQWLRRYGEAVLDTHVAPGQVVPVWYAPPFHQFTHGDIGHVKQSRRGLGVLLGVIAALVAVPLLIVLAAVLL
jgi:hypothetical protein